MARREPQPGQAKPVSACKGQGGIHPAVAGLIKNRNPSASKAAAHSAAECRRNEADIVLGCAMLMAQLRE